LTPKLMLLKMLSLNGRLPGRHWHFRFVLGGHRNSNRDLFHTRPSSPEYYLRTHRAPQSTDFLCPEPSFCTPPEHNLQPACPRDTRAVLQIFPQLAVVRATLLHSSRTVQVLPAKKRRETPAHFCLQPRVRLIWGVPRGTPQLDMAIQRVSLRLGMDILQGRGQVAILPRVTPHPALPL
jgi:hypothetical protein